MTNKESSNSIPRPKRFVEGRGEIPSTLPSAYDFIGGEYGQPNLVQMPLAIAFIQHENQWNAAIQTQPDKRHIDGVRDAFISLYTSDSSVPHNWKREYTKLLAMCAQGWIREQFSTGNIHTMDVLTIGRFADALKQHLIDAEKNIWAVEWLTSRRPIHATAEIPSQEARNLPSLDEYHTQYREGHMSGSTYFLNVAGDFLINLARLSTPEETYSAWQRAADVYASEAHVPKRVVRTKWYDVG